MRQVATEVDTLLIFVSSEFLDTKQILIYSAIKFDHVGLVILTGL